MKTINSIRWLCVNAGNIFVLSSGVLIWNHTALSIICFLFGFIAEVAAQFFAEEYALRRSASEQVEVS